MKLIIGLALSLFTVGAMANKDKNWDKMTFDQQKQMMTEKLDKKSAMIQESRSCVNEAGSKDALKTCKEEMKEERQAMKDEWKDKKKQAEEAIEE